MEKQLPKNWIECSLGEIIKTKKGKKPNSTIDYPKEGYVPYILIDEMEGKPIRSYTNDPNVSIVSEDEVLLVWDGSIGKCGSGINGAIGSTLVALKPLSNIPTRFIEYTLINKNSFIKQTSTGTGLQHINKDFFKNCFIGLPPLSEQIRIVAKVDALFMQLESIKESMINVPLLLKDFRQEVLKQAVNGKLTEDFRIKHGPFEDAMLFVDRIKTKKELVKNISNNLPENWVKVRIGEVFHVVRGSSPRPKGDPKYFSDKRTNFHWIMLSDFTKNTKENMLIDTNEFLTEEGSKLSRYVCKDDLLIGASGVYGVGRTCFLDIDGYIYDGIMAIKSIKNHSLKMFMNYFMQLQRMNFMKVATGTSWPNINTDILNKYEFPIPPIDEQLEIVSRIESLFAKADIIEQQYKVLKNKIDNLPQAILRKAFKGELTEQLESEGDARELLKEIEALKATSGKVGKKFGKTVKNFDEKEVVLDMVAKPREKTKSKVVKLKPTNSEIYKRTLLAAEIVYQLKDTNTLGHLKLQKMLYLCQEIGSMNLPMNFLKQAMGPYDNLLARSLDKQFVVKKWFEYQKEALLKYKPLENCGNHKGDFLKYFETEVEQINYLINKFKKFTSNQIEAVATLYACWKEAIEKKELITDKLIITKFYQWSKEKEKFREENLFKALDWMRRNGVEPK